MRTTLNIDVEPLAQAQQLTGLTERTQLIREALLALVQPRVPAVWRSWGATGIKSGSAPSGHYCMMLVDTSVWIDHLRRSDAELVALLLQGQVLVYPRVGGELTAAICKTASWCWIYCSRCPWLR